MLDYDRRVNSVTRLVELLPSLRPEPMPIHAIYPSGRLVPSRVKLALRELEVLRTRRVQP